MDSGFYSAGEHRADKVNQLFKLVATRYDLINDLQSFGLHRYWKRRLVRLAKVTPGEQALDVCSGTGDLAFLLAKRGAQTVGVDFNHEMLGVAKARLARRGAGSGTVRFIHGDAQQIPFPDNTFDLVTVGYGLRNLASWEKGIAEMHRVTKPGGRVLILEFGKPENRVWRLIYFAYLRRFVPLLGWLMVRNANAYSYILESLNHYPGQTEVASKMLDLGFSEARVFNLLGGIMSIHYGLKTVSKA